MRTRWSATRILLVIFAACLVPASVLALGLGLDAFVRPPDLADTLDLPSRLVALQPFFEARWPYDFVSSLLFVVGFGALALAAGPIVALAGDDPRAIVLKAAILVTGLLGVATGLLYIGATQVTIVQSYCDCGFKNEETISRFWALNIVQGATYWLSNGAAVFGAIAVATSALVFGKRGLSALWSRLGWVTAALLILTVVLPEVIHAQEIQYVGAVTTGILLPAWAIIFARRSDRLDPSPG